MARRGARSTTVPRAHRNGRAHRGWGSVTVGSILPTVLRAWGVCVDRVCACVAHRARDV